MERFYPRMAQFARGEGYPCGNKGVFIPRRNKCWTHPKTGQRMRKPLTYQNYQDAKEKSQKSRTEKGRTALANREQSFRDKAREKVKGWQNKTPDSDATKRAIADIGKVKSGQILLNEKERYRLQHDRGTYLLNDPKLSTRQGGVSKKLTEKEATDFLSEQYEKGETKYTPDRSQLGGVGHKLFIDSNTPEGKALLEAEELVKKTKKTSSNHRVAVDFKNVATIDYIAKRSANSPTKEQQEYDNRQPDKIELEKGAGLSEGWRSENAKRRYSGKSEDITAHNDVTGIPWKVTSPGGREDVIVGAKVSDSYGGKERQLTLHKSDGTMSFSPFAKNDKEKENRAKRLVKEITQGKSRNVNIDEINSMINGSKSEPKQAPNSTGVKGAGGKRETDIKDTAPPTPKLKSKDHAANEKYDQWLISESQKLEGKEKNYSIGTESGKKSVRGKVYENFGIHEDRGRYNLTQLSSGKMLSYYDNEDQAKKSIVELNRSGGIDWKTKDLESIPGIQTKMKSVKRKIDAVIESDKRAKELIESMMKDHEKELWDFSSNLAGYGVKVPKKQKNNFNSNLKLANFAKPGCCCDASKPLRRRKTKQTPRLKRRGNKYA